MTSKLKKQFPEFQVLENIHENEDGMVAWAMMVAILFLACFSGLVYNAGSTVSKKLETQNAADSVAYSGSLWMARGMNAMTATNHVIGELNALYVIHHAFAGKWLDEQGREENNVEPSLGLSTGLEIAYNAANVAPKTIPVFSKHKDTTKHPNADRNSAIFDAKIQLKGIMTAAYVSHLAGAVLEKFVITTAAGIAVEVAALAVEWKVYQEYLVLDGLEMLMNSTKVIKDIIPATITGLHGYQQAAEFGIPALALDSASSLAERQGASGNFYGDVVALPLLPVEKEETSNERRSQLMRATFPWVAAWRKNINRFLIITCTLSGARGYYTEWSNKYTLQACEWLRTDSGSTYSRPLTVQNHGTSRQSGNGESGKKIHLYVVKGLNETQQGISKSQEKWNDWDNRSDATSEIEKQFCHVGFAHKTAPRVGVARFYRQENPRGMVCFAQSMVYNANEQQRPAPPGPAGGNQPRVGWDTLGWTNDVKEFPQRYG